MPSARADVVGEEVVGHGPLAESDADPVAGAVGVVAEAELLLHVLGGEGVVLHLVVEERAARSISHSATVEPRCRSLCAPMWADAVDDAADTEAGEAFERRADGEHADHDAVGDGEVEATPRTEPEAREDETEFRRETFRRLVDRPRVGRRTAAARCAGQVHRSDSP